MNRDRARTWTAVICLTALAAGVRVWDLARHAMWVDELYSLETSAGHGLQEHGQLPHGSIGAAPDLTGLGSANPWWTVPRVMSGDTHPPLYFMLLRGWREAFGDTPTVARGLSVLAGVAGVPLLFLLGRELLGAAATA